MEDQIIIAIIAAVLGGGGIGGAIVSALANRKKVEADIVANLSCAYETRLANLNDRIAAADTKIEILQSQASNLKQPIIS